MNYWLFFDRDISWLRFNERVLMEAANETVPLFERFKFLAIFSSNLDEFYRVRMPAILAVEKIRGEKKTENIYEQARQIIIDQQVLFGKILNEQLIPKLKAAGYILTYNEAIPAELEQAVTNYFFTQVAGLLQPVCVSCGNNFFPENNQIYLAAITQVDDGEEQLYLVNIPCEALSRFYKIEHAGSTYLLFLEDIISQNLYHVLNGTIRGTYNIKITRDAALELADDYEEDLAEKIEKQLMKRDMGFATRFLYQPEIPLRHLESLIDAFNLQNASVMEGGRHHNLKDLVNLPVSGDGFTYPAWPSYNRIVYTSMRATLFEKVAAEDQVIHAPYQSYDAVLRFFNEAAIDPTVEEISTTFYRVANDSRIAQALISAAKNGKNVAVLVELKARFDEANNIRWAKKMKAAGVRIIYSDTRLKVHAKVALVKRKNETAPLLGLLATGNLNESTARFYTDHILLTAHREMLKELSRLFAWLSRKKGQEKTEEIFFKHLLVARFNLQNDFIKFIEREINHAQAGLPASIIIKLNNLEEEVMIRKLYEASNAGVKIQLIVRSICRLMPGVPGQSENITARRIVDRYLEHGRVFIFENNGNPQLFMGSADWMNRNIYRRIEVCFPVYNEAIKKEIIQLIDLQLQDNVKAVWIGHDLANIPVTNEEQPLRSQEAIYNFLQP